MSLARRVLLVTAVAAIAVVPLRAFGVVGGDAPSGLSVSASLAGCGVAGEGVVCTIEVEFGGVEGADHYTATLTRADGSVQDLGTVGSGEGGGSASVGVPYVGAGTYSVSVSAWDSADEEGGEEAPELLERERAETEGSDGSDEAPADPPTDDSEGSEADPADPGAGEETSDEGSEPALEEPGAQTLPPCRESAAEPADPVAPADRAGEADEEGFEPEAGPPAPSVDCTEPSADESGAACCPPGA